MSREENDTNLFRTKFISYSQKFCDLFLKNVPMANKYSKKIEDLVLSSYIASPNDTLIELRYISNLGYQYESFLSTTYIYRIDKEEGLRIGERLAAADKLGFTEVDSPACYAARRWLDNIHRGWYAYTPIN